MSDMMKQGIANSHMPFFSNQEGFAGMYDGIRTGIPSVCIEKFNPQMLIGMKAQADSGPQLYDRNFTCEFCPTPPPKGKVVKAKEMYDLYRMYRVLAGARGAKLRETGLSWRAHVDPLLRCDDDSDEALW